MKIEERNDRATGSGTDHSNTFGVVFITNSTTLFQDITHLYNRGIKLIIVKFQMGIHLRHVLQVITPINLFQKPRFFWLPSPF